MHTAYFHTARIRPLCLGVVAILAQSRRAMTTMAGEAVSNQGSVLWSYAQATTSTAGGGETR